MRGRFAAGASPRAGNSENSLILIDCGHYLCMTDDERRLLRDFTHLLGPTLDGAYHLVEKMERCTGVRGVSEGAVVQAAGQDRHRDGRMLLHGFS